MLFIQETKNLKFKKKIIAHATSPYQGMQLTLKETPL